MIYKKMLDTLLNHSVPEVAVNEFQDNAVIFLDSRELEEYTVSKIKTATWVGYDDFSMSRVKDIPKDSEIIVYCSVGYRSEKIAEKLIHEGYSNVSNLYGGIFEWVNNNRPIVDAQEQSTNKIHAYDRIWGLWLNEGKKVYK
jgi:rhodanese-related sulfurtransferase